MQVWRDPRSLHFALAAMAIAFVTYLLASALGVPIEFLTYSPH